MEREELSVCIAGAGLAGLAVARFLQMNGFKNVTIFEKDTSIESRPQGYSLSIQQAGTVLRRLGLGDVLDSTKASNSAYHTLNSEGKTLLFHGASNPAEKRGHNIPIPRQYLRQKLFELLEPNTVVWNASIRDFKVNQASGKDQRKSVDVTFEDGTTKTFSCLIGGDGIRSRVREILIGDPHNYLGVMSIVGIAPTNNHPLLRSRVIQILDGSQRVFIKPFDDDTCMWQLTYKRDTPDSSLTNMQEWALAEAQRRCQGWMDPIPALIASTLPSKIRYAPLYDREPLSATSPARKFDGPVALLGDAAHPMSPFKGQGANQALEDARDLSSCILDAFSSGEPLEAAFQRFVALMAKRSVPKVLKSREHVAFYHQPTCIYQPALLEYHGLKDTDQLRAAIAKADSYLPKLDPK